jgi:hypothetical protein
MKSRFRAALALACIVVARNAHADPDRAAQHVDALVRALASDDPTARAKAATDLGETFPRGASAALVLLDVTEDDESVVRTATVRALRRLGRAGLDEAAQHLSALDANTARALSSMGAVATLLGDATTPTDIANGVAAAAERGSDSLRAMLWTIAATEMPALDVAPIVERWVDSPIGPVARTAAATLAILGRSAVTFGPISDAGVEESPPSLAPLLSHADAAIQWTAWRLAARGAPHGDAMASAILARWASKKSPLRTEPQAVLSEEDVTGPPMLSEVSLTVGAFEDTLLSIGSRGSAVAREAVERLRLEGSARGSEVLWRLGVRDAALVAWHELVARTTGLSLRDRIELSEVIRVAERIPGLLHEMAPHIEPLLTAFSRRGQNGGVPLELYDFTLRLRGRSTTRRAGSRSSPSATPCSTAGSPGSISTRRCSRTLRSFERRSSMRSRAPRLDRSSSSKRWPQVPRFPRPQ